jgi:hypothetical protein
MGYVGGGDDVINMVQDALQVPPIPMYRVEFFSFFRE